MVNQPLPFDTHTVAKSKHRRLLFRIVLLCMVMCLFIATASHHLDWFPKFALMDGVPFALMLYVVRVHVPKVRLPNVGLAILFRSIVYTVVFLTMFSLMFVSANPSGATLRTFEKASPLIAVIMLMAYIQVLFITGIRGVSRKLGPGTFWNWIRGYYYTPKEEERIFMFLDIRHSTQLAEQLGDLKFSKFVRDFFDDLTSPITETRAEVSHYIGDEVVLTWWPDRGFNDANCMQLFFRMQSIIDRRRQYYMDEYGVVPEFKAGAHIGHVVATEVGNIKSEIVYHGDVLNTTSRVQGACNELGAQFLITDALAQRLPPAPWLELQPIGAVALKGKTEKVQLLSATVKTK